MSHVINNNVCFLTMYVVILGECEHGLMTALFSLLSGPQVNPDTNTYTFTLCDLCHNNFVAVDRVFNIAGSSHAVKS